MGNCLSSSTEQLATASGAKVFTVAELKKATKDFGEDVVIKESFGGVVRGYINPMTLSPAKEGFGMAVAVKICYLPDEQAWQEWLVRRLHIAGDVYSFGVILLKILTGLENRRITLAKEAIRNDKEDISEMFDPDLENSYPLEAGRLVCKLIKQCLEKKPKKRPSMQLVLDNLNAITKI